MRHTGGFYDWLSAQNWAMGEKIMILVILGIAGAALGITFADIDLAPPLPVKHRSAWTHGLPVPLSMAWLVGVYPDSWSFAGAFLITYALHLLCDMFPRSWKGSALINLYPVPGSLPAHFSFAWLLAGVVVSVWFSSRIMGYDGWLAALYYHIF
jgi:hypothetical protein